MWKCVLCQDHVRSQASADAAAMLERLRGVAAAARPSPPTWVLIMLRGGHFAAAVLRAKPPAAPSASATAAAAAASSGRLDPAAEPFEVVDHKTFHRYVVRCVQEWAGGHGYLWAGLLGAVNPVITRSHFDAFALRA